KQLFLMSSAILFMSSPSLIVEAEDFDEKKVDDYIQSNNGIEELLNSTDENDKDIVNKESVNSKGDDILKKDDPTEYGNEEVLPEDMQLDESDAVDANKDITDKKSPKKDNIQP